MTKVQEAEILRHGHSYSQGNLQGFLPGKPLSQIRRRTTIVRRYLLSISKDLTMSLFALEQQTCISNCICLLRRCGHSEASARISNEESLYRHYTTGWGMRLYCPSL